MLVTAVFKSDKEERRELTELAKCLHSAIFNINWKVKEAV